MPIPALLTPRELAGFVVEEAARLGVAADDALDAETAARTLAMAGQRALGMAVRRGAAAGLRLFAEMAAERVERAR